MDSNQTIAVHLLSLIKRRVNACLWVCPALILASMPVGSAELPIADVHVHYSHDSVEQTPPSRVIELMESAGLKFALVSSSDDEGTRLLREAAPDLIVPGLRPYRKRGELRTWFTDPAALEYIEKLLASQSYATIGEFHLYGETVDLPIPQKMVELAEQHNLILHAHSDADAVDRLLASSDVVKVLWAHAGFDGPEAVAKMLRKHDRLWADLAFRSEVGSGGTLQQEWLALFEEFPDRIMLGTDTYTPERMYYLPEHAANARVWLQGLPAELAERLAWRNAFDLIMPVWQKNRDSFVATAAAGTTAANDICAAGSISQDALVYEDESLKVLLEPASDVKASTPFAAVVTLCHEQTSEVSGFELDARMPAHGHGMNYNPEISLLSSADGKTTYNVEGLVFHMSGEWEWAIGFSAGDEDYQIQKSVRIE